MSDIDNDLKIAKTRYNEAIDFFKKYNLPRFQRYYKNYRNDVRDRLQRIRQHGDESWQANIGYPLTSSYIDSIIPIVNDNLPKLGVRSGGLIPQDYTKQVNSYLNDYWYERAGYEVVRDNLVLNTALYGVSYRGLTWKTVYNIMFEYKNGNINDVSGTIEEMQNKRVNDPVAESLDVYSTYPDPFAKDNQSIRYWVSRHLLTKEEGMNRYANLFDPELFKQKGDIKTVFDKIISQGDTSDYSAVRYETLLKTPEKMDESKPSGLIPTGLGEASVVGQNNKFEFVEVMTPQDITIYSGEVLICKIKNYIGENLIDIIQCRNPERGIWGIGIAEDLDIAHYYINNYINQEADIASIDNTPMYAYHPDYADQQMDSNLRVSPGKMIAMPPDMIKSLDRGGSLGLSYKIIDFLKLSAREGVGIDETTRGSSLPSSTVATQVNAIRESTNRRVNKIIANLARSESDMIRKILMLGYLLYPTQDFEGKEIFNFTVNISSVKDDEFIPVEKEAFNYKLYRYLPMTSKYIEFSREVSLKESLTLLQEINKMIGNPTAAKSLENFSLEPVLKDIFLKFGYTYEKPKELPSVANVEAVTALANAQNGEPITSPDMASQLPDSNMMSTGQNLSTINNQYV